MIICQLVQRRTEENTGTPKEGGKKQQLLVIFAKERFRGTKLLQLQKASEYLTQ